MRDKYGRDIYELYLNVEIRDNSARPRITRSQDSFYERYSWAQLPGGKQNYTSDFEFMCRI
jgi:hypothetical protein